MEHYEIPPEVVEEIFRELAEEQPENGGRIQAMPQDLWHNEILPAAAQKGAFRLNASKVALTYSRCPLEKADVADFFENIWCHREKVKFVVVAQEVHEGKLTLDEEESEFHLHIYIEFNKKVDIRNATAFDLLDTVTKKVFHPNIKTSYSPKGWINYITKEDKEPAVRGTTLEGIIAKYGTAEKDSARDEVGRKLMSGEVTLLQLCHEKPRHLWELPQLKKSLLILDGLKNETSIQDWQPLTTDKKRHYWVWGDSNTGKSTVLGKLIDHNPKLWFQIPTNNDWIGYGNQPYLYIDEFSGALTLEKINLICDGGAKMNVKGSSTIICKKPVVLIISNSSPEMLYHAAFEKNKRQQNALANRFIVICSDDEGWEKELKNFYPPEEMPLLQREDQEEEPKANGALVQADECPVPKLPDFLDEID